MLETTFIRIVFSFILYFQLLLYEETKEAKYKTLVDSFVKSYMPGGSVHQTPCGLAWRDMWGSLRYSGNAWASGIKFSR